MESSRPKEWGARPTCSAELTPGGIRSHSDTGRPSESLGSGQQSGTATQPQPTTSQPTPTHGQLAHSCAALPSQIPPSQHLTQHSMCLPAHGPAGTSLTQSPLTRVPRPAGFPHYCQSVNPQFLREDPILWPRQISTLSWQDQAQTAVAKSQARASQCHGHFQFYSLMDDLRETCSSMPRYFA